jgi:putative DNA primase/helicase
MNQKEYEHIAASLDDDAGLTSDAVLVDFRAMEAGSGGQLDAKHSSATYRREVVLTNGADLTPEPVSWLWRDWLARGKLHLLAGAPGQGKTTIAMAMAATVSMGGRWPDGSRCEPGNVLIWSGEDDPADTLLPRLIASGAERSRCFFVSGTQFAGKLQAFNPATDMSGLERQARAIGGISLLIVDPVVSAVAGDSHKNAEVRRDLQPIVDLATRLGAAAIGITHLSKGGAGGDPATRVIGSIAFTAVARVVLLVAKVRGEDGQERRILARGKSNIGPDNGGFEYDIEQSEPLPGIHASYITWGQAVDGTARELLTDSEVNGDSASDSDRSDAVEMLRLELTADGWTKSELASKPLADAGFNKKAIWKASKTLGVIRQKRGFGENSAFYWRLPGGADIPLSAAHVVSAINITPIDSHIDSIDSGVGNWESMESMESMVTVEPMNTGRADVEVF